MVKKMTRGEKAWATRRKNVAAAARAEKRAGKSKSAPARKKTERKTRKG